MTQQINALAGCARAEGDYTSEQFMQWFIKEQVEEVATMSDLLRVVERSRDDVMEVENYMAREHSGGEGDGSHRAASPPALEPQRCAARAPRPLGRVARRTRSCAGSATGRWTRRRSASTSARTTCS